MPNISPIGPSSPSKKNYEAESAKSADPASEKVQSIVNNRAVFGKNEAWQGHSFKASVGLPQNRFLGLADLLEIDHTEEMLAFLKDYTDKEFIDEINAFKHLPIIDHAIKQISLSLKKWDASEDRLKLQETLTNQFQNLELLIDIITDILPLVGEKVSQLQDTPELRKYMTGQEPIEGETPFKIRDHFLHQLGR